MMNRAQRIALRRIIESLRSEPHMWKIDDFEAKSGNMVVWIANSYYGIDFAIGRVRFTSSCFPLWFLNPFGWWRYELMDACRDAEAVQMLNSLERS